MGPSTLRIVAVAGLLLVGFGAWAQLSTSISHSPLGTAGDSPASGYWMVASDGGVFTFGDAAFHGGTGLQHLNRPIVGMAATPDGQGYWLVASDGGVFTFGDAAFYGGTGGQHLNRPIVGMAATPDGQGYWLVASDGGVFTFGDATFYGGDRGPAPQPAHRGHGRHSRRTGLLAGGLGRRGLHLRGRQRSTAGPVASTSTGPSWAWPPLPTDRATGWWPRTEGSSPSGTQRSTAATGGQHLNRPIVGMAATPDGQGYWLVASDGGVFTFGDATFYGGTGGQHLNQPIVGMATPSGSVGQGYCGRAVGTPTTTKLMVIYEENTDASSIYGSSSAPNINTYAAECGSAQNYQALTHPSLPNYLASTSGLSYATSPWTSDCDPGGSCLTGNDNIFNQVGPSGWKAYAESMTTNCQAGSSGTYATKHNPAAYYTDVSSQCLANDVPMGTTSSGALHDDVVNGTLPTFSTVTPDLDNDMHNGSIQQGDSWLGGWIPQITAGPDYQSGHLTIIIVWDEGSGSGNSPSTVAMIAMSPDIVPGTTSSTYFTHSSLLKAAEDVAGVPELGGAASANSLRTAFGF